jgi:phosphatidate cytidylyltransferase
MHERVSFVIVGKLAKAEIFIHYPTQFVLLLAVIALFVFCVILVELFRNNGSAILNIASTIFGALDISLFLGMLIATRELFEWEHFNAFFMSKSFKELQGSDIKVLTAGLKTWGGYFIFSVFVTIWICDSAAYFAGRAFGKRKLFERVSPNKTWEGAIAGFLFSIITMVAAKFLVIQFLSIYHAIAIGIIIGIFGQIGDLCQSLLKRDSGIKDSSALIPGHGGFFDRFDSIIFVSPLIYLYVDLVVLYF